MERGSRAAVCARLSVSPLNLPPPPLLLLLLLPMPQTTGRGVWREQERAGAAETGYARHWPISAQPSGPGLGAGPMRGRGRGQPETYTLAGPSGTPARRAKAAVWEATQAQQGLEGRVEQVEGCAGAAVEPPQELHASRVCRDCRRDEDLILLFISLIYLHILNIIFIFIFFLSPPPALFVSSP